MASVVMVLGGLALLAWNTRQRLGRSRSARAWAGPRTTSFARRNVLVLWPLIGVALLLAGALVLARGSSAATPLGLLLLAALALWLAYAVLPLPVPGWLEPRWYRPLHVAASRRADRHG
ncbi:MAG: hypothetical protein JWN22_3685 [Nocardioides sp.]|jgi:hypothetical protein|nr:hypothetical protein [Nocardioides sp.]